MAKRTNPFAEDYVPQSKVHVGLKQFNNNEDRLKKVYEKTLEKLYRGANKQTVTESYDHAHNTSSVSKDKMKQLFIGKDGTLSTSGTMIMSSNVQAEHCACGCEFISACSYCEKVLCNVCRCHCSCCDKFYCSLCSLTGLEGSKVCVSCYS